MHGVLFSPKEKSNFYLASSLYDSIEDKNLKQLLILLEIKHADANVYIPSIGTTPIHAAVEDKSETFSVEAIKLMLQHGGNPNVQTDEGITPIHLAVAKQNIEVLKLLLNNGGDPFILDNNGRSCFHYALENKYHDILDILYDYCKDSQTKDEESNYEMSLEKVILDDGLVIAEYTPDVRECVCIKDDENKKSLEEKYELMFHQSVFSQSLNFNSNKSWKSIFSNFSHTDCKLSDMVTMETETKKVTDKTSLHNTDNELNHIYYINNVNKAPFLKSDEEPNSVSDFDNLLYRLRNNEVVGSSNSENDFKETDEENSNKFQVEGRCIDLTDQNLKLYNEIVHDRRIVIDEEYKYSDNEEKVTLIERRLCTPGPGETSDNTSFYSCKPDMWYPLPNVKDKLDPPPMLLRQRLIEHGQNPGPITTETYGVYLKRLKKLSGERQKFSNKNSNSASKKKDNIVNAFSRLEIRDQTDDSYRKELLILDVTKRHIEYECLEEEMQCEFIRPEPTRRWREGTSKNAFNYLLLDPRVTQDLPRRANQLTENEKWEIFLSAIFYIGKGKRSRPYAHLYDAFHIWTSRKSVPEMSSKCKKIIDIWNEGKGVVALHVFQNIIPVEAYTREALMIETLGLSRLANCKRGEYYGPVNVWPSSKKRMLGKSLLFKAMQILCFEGERQLFPENI